MPRKRKRRIAWVSLLWIALVANIAAGLWLSPITSLRKVRVQGASEETRAQLTREIWRLNGVPVSKIDPREFESRIQRLSAIRTADFSRGLFGSAVLIIEPRRAVARIAGESGAFLDDTGAVFSSNLLPAGIPILVLPREAREMNLSLAETWPSASVAEICSRMTEFPQFEDSTVEIGGSGSVSLTTGLGARVFLGSTEKLDEKFSELKRLLGERPELLARIESLNLTAPALPKIVPKKRGSNP